MLTPDAHPPQPGEAAYDLHHAHHDHGPLGGPDDFANEQPADLCAECAWTGPGCCLTPIQS